MGRYFAIQIYTSESRRPVGEPSLFKIRETEVTPIVQGYAFSSGLYKLVMEPNSTDWEQHLTVLGPEKSECSKVTLFKSRAIVDNPASWLVYYPLGVLLQFSAETDEDAELLFRLQLKEELQ